MIVNSELIDELTEKCFDEWLAIHEDEDGGMWDCDGYHYDVYYSQIAYALRHAYETGYMHGRNREKQ